MFESIGKRKKTWGGGDRVLGPADKDYGGISNATGAIGLPDMTQPVVRSTGNSGSAPSTGGNVMLPGVTVINGGQNFSGGATSWNTCKVDHNGDEVVYQFPNGTQLFGADKAGAQYNKPDLILDFADYQTTPKPFILGGAIEPTAMAELNDLCWRPRIIRFTWPDGSAPWHVGIKFWLKLLERLKAEPPNSRIVACCHGGHGRTGTGLAALLIAEGFDDVQAIALLRERHCKKAVENKSQEYYLEELFCQRQQLESVDGE